MHFTITNKWINKSFSNPLWITLILNKFSCNIFRTTSFSFRHVCKLTKQMRKTLPTLRLHMISTENMCYQRYQNLMGSLFASQQWTDQGPPFKISFISKQWLAWGGIYMKNTENHTLWLLNNSLNSEDNEPGGNSWKAENGTKPVWVVSRANVASSPLFLQMGKMW